MLIEETLLFLYREVAKRLRETMKTVPDSNILKPIIRDWCEFVESAAVGDDDGTYPVTTILALKLTDLIKEEDADRICGELNNVGVYGAWEKGNVKAALTGKTASIDSWIESEMLKKGDLIMPKHIIDELCLLNSDCIGGVQ